MAKTKTVKTTALLRKGALAYIGLYGAAYERAQMRVSQLRGQADGLFGTLVIKGEEIEGKAVVFAKDAQLKAAQTFSTTSSKVRGVLPSASNDRVEELEAEITKLNETISAMALKKTNLKKAKAKKTKTIKTSKTAAYTQSSLTKMLEKDLVALAQEMGIEASIADLKADTVAKILAKIATPVAA